jgi:hypothetical protein
VPDLSNLSPESLADAATSTKPQRLQCGVPYPAIVLNAADGVTPSKSAYTELTFKVNHKSPSGIKVKDKLWWTDKALNMSMGRMRAMGLADAFKESLAKKKPFSPAEFEGAECYVTLRLDTAKQKWLEIDRIMTAEQAADFLAKSKPAPQGEDDVPF